jgi:hypothetical protein
MSRLVRCGAVGEYHCYLLDSVFQENRMTVAFAFLRADPDVWTSSPNHHRRMGH